jgi:hypothetical protein
LDAGAFFPRSASLRAKRSNPAFKPTILDCFVGLLGFLAMTTMTIA